MKTSSEKLQLFRTSATEPWAEIEATQGNHLRVVKYNNGAKAAMTLTKREAEELYKAIDYMVYNYLENDED
jgi:hypothetical protein